MPKDKTWLIPKNEAEKRFHTSALESRLNDEAVNTKDLHNKQREKVFLVMYIFEPKSSLKK